MWQSKAWDVLNQLLAMAIILVGSLMIWSSLARMEAWQKNETRQAESNQRKITETLEAIRERMDPEQWQQVKPLVEKQKMQP